MTRKTLGLENHVYDYILEFGVREADLLKELREETSADPMHRMQVSPEQGALMQLLLRTMGARQGIEVGVFTGYSSLSLALALPEDGRLVACDINDEWASVAQRYWKKAGVEDRIQFHLRPAVETLDDLLQKGEQGRYDFAFIDADKESYEQYYERCLKLIRQGGLLIVDNVLWGGKVANELDLEETTCIIRAFNEKRIKDRRVELSMIPVADGITLMRKTLTPPSGSPLSGGLPLRLRSPPKGDSERIPTPAILSRMRT